MKRQFIHQSLSVHKNNNINNKIIKLINCYQKYQIVKRSVFSLDLEIFDKKLN